jgi:pimeloyl-ACP methyl ester carboxylesterase
MRFPWGHKERMMTAPHAPLLDPRERHFMIAGPNEGLRLFLRHLAPARPAHRKRAVLYVHGATFPSALSIAHRFDGVSWRDVLCDAGFDVWGLDFQGFGGSDRYPQMQEPAEKHPPLCDTADAARQVEAAVRFICAQEKLAHVSLIAHSWGSMPAASFAGAHPDRVERLVLFGPIAQRAAQNMQAPPAPAWRVVTPAAHWERFYEDVPAGNAPPMARHYFDEWAERYLDSDPHARLRDPHGVKTPAGPFAAIVKAWNGALDYDPARVTAPVAIIRGEWDGLLPDADARWLFDAFASSPVKRDIKISKATHLMHLEAMRHALHHESVAFLNEADAAR